MAIALKSQRSLAIDIKDRLDYTYARQHATWFHKSLLLKTAGYFWKKMIKRFGNKHGASMWLVVWGRQRKLVMCSWWRHQMETFSALLALCAGNSPATGEFPAQRPVTQSFGVFFDLRLNKRLSKQWWGWWFETPSHLLWRHSNVETEIVAGVCPPVALWTLNVKSLINDAPNPKT